MKRLQTLVLGIAIVAGSVMAAAAAAGPLTIARWTVDCGGAHFSRVGTWTLAGTVGQADAGTLAGMSYTVYGGFWGGKPLNVTAAPIPDPTDPVSNPTPRVARVLPAMPNPTENASRIRFELPEARRVRIQVFSVGGGLVRTVTDRVWAAGRHQVAWDGRDAAGGASAAGLYFVRVLLGSMERTQKLLIVR